MQTVFTLGYEGADSDQFIRVLKARGVTTLIDVRAKPISRKKGFSKSALAGACTSSGINYEHWIDLGCPEEIRTAYKASSDWAAYTRSFKRHLPSISSKVKELAEKAADETLCLVCFEADPTTCHRYYIAEEMEKISTTKAAHLSIKGLVVAGG